MWLERYPALYHDDSGEVTTTIENDGKELRMELRGVKFSGMCLDDWATDADISQLQAFTFHRNELCDYLLEFSMPLRVVFLDEQIEGKLHARSTLGRPAANGGVDREELHLALTVANFSFVSKRKSGDFETELLDINEQLPTGMYIKICLFCVL